MANGVTGAEAAFEAAGIPWDVSLPEQQFRQYAGQQFRPGLNYLRSAFYGMQDPLMQQYYLGAPQMAQPFGDFGQFMTQRGGEPAAGAAPWNPSDARTAALVQAGIWDRRAVGGEQGGASEPDGLAEVTC
jgi:hypothetical protein